MIRAATAVDFPAIAEVGQHFHSSIAHRDIPYSIDSMRRWLPRMRQQGLLYVAEHEGKIVGGIGGLYAPLYFNDQYRIAQELFWWVEPDHRARRAWIKLLRAFESAAASAGCAWITMLLLAGPNAPQLERFYLRDGYRPSEWGFTKVITCQQPQQS